MIRNRYNRIPYPALTPNEKGTHKIRTALKYKEKYQAGKICVIFAIEYILE